MQLLFPYRRFPVKRQFFFSGHLAKFLSRLSSLLQKFFHPVLLGYGHETDISLSIRLLALGVLDKLPVRLHGLCETFVDCLLYTLGICNGLLPVPDGFREGAMAATVIVDAYSE